MRNQAIFLMGPTAIGKTELALRLSQIYPSEIISVDSALIYQDLDIGSAKPSLGELASVPHHLVNIISPLESYSVADFHLNCNRLIAEINQRGRLPILIGGTMLYFNALISGISELPAANLELRAELDKEFAKYGNQVMYQRLLKLDEISARKIAVNDTQRLQRALEISILCQKPMSQVQTESKLPGLVNCNYLPLAILPTNRELLQQRINDRFNKMLNLGFVAEVQQLQLKYPGLTARHNSMRCVGYRQVWDYLANRLSYAELIEQGQAATRQLAKRQLTWLRGIACIAIDDFQLDIDILLKKISGKIQEFIDDKQL